MLYHATRLAFGVTVGIAIIGAPAKARAYATELPAPNAATTSQEPKIRVAWAFLLGTVARGAVAGTVARGALGAGATVGAGAYMTRGAMAATPRAYPSYGRGAYGTYNYRPTYYQPQIRIAPSVRFQVPSSPSYYGNSYASGNSHYGGYQSGYVQPTYAQYQPPQRQCWTTGYEVIPTYNGRIVRRHYRCSYR